MSIIKKPYEISVWDERLRENGQKEEFKKAIIGADDMTYLGRATSPNLTKNLNGTHTFTFKMPSKFFDSAIGQYIHNEFCDNVFNERKIKLKYDGEWYEFYVKNITETKQFKSIIYQYICEDAFIDELSRNGYGITFDTELYNNVEEIGTFSETILKDSIWEYDPTKNWGDFTEYSEEKLFKIPVSMFNSIRGYKLEYIVDGKMTNIFTNEMRPQELGDDISRNKYFWDNGEFDEGIPLLNQKSSKIENDGYIYVPYSCLSFCHINSVSSQKGYAATQVAAAGTISGINSYYLTPSSIDPTSLIQFIAIPKNAEIQVDEAGLLVNKNYSYVMTLKDWNETINTRTWYDIETQTISKAKSLVNKNFSENGVVCYSGYLDSINGIDLTFGKKISIADRTEINISKDIDQYVTVYNNNQKDFEQEFSSEDWIAGGTDYRICSYEDTRLIIPQLARNLIQNGTNMTETSGWEVMKMLTGVGDTSSSISVRTNITTEQNGEISIDSPDGLLFNYNCKYADKTLPKESFYKTFINFGIVGQEETISKDQTYVLYINALLTNQNGDSKKGFTYENLSDNLLGEIKVLIGEGNYDVDGDYTLNNSIEIQVKPNQYYFIRPKINIKNPYFAIDLSDKPKGDSILFNLKTAIFSKAYTKGKDFFDLEDIKYKYTGRDIFFSPKDWNSTEGLYYRKAAENEFLKETDIVEGDTYTYKRYFRQQIQTKDEKEVKDTFMLKSYLQNDVDSKGFDPTKYTEDDFKIVTDYIDLNRCSYYNINAEVNDKDCSHSNGNGICMYQKYGYCPYRFQTQKHCRKIRTLSGEKSNRFNLTQELSKVFEIYPIYYTEHEENGKIKTDIITDENGEEYKRMRKKVFYITEKGKENKLGFRYEKNLKDISRTFDSKEIVTKLYVQDVDSNLSSTGLCSIKTAEDNPSKDSYIFDFSYYTMKGLLNKADVDADLYGTNDSDIGYLKQLGYYNGKYDELSNLIINLQDESYTELEANIEVNLTGIETAQQELNKINKNLSKYSAKKTDSKGQEIENDTYLSYQRKYIEQKNILLGLIEDTFSTNGKYDNIDLFSNIESPNAEKILAVITEYGFKTFKEDYLDTFKYKDYGIMGQYTAEYLQIQQWKKERAKYLKDINRLSLQFYKKYEPYLKEGTWSDSNYLSDNAYYFGAKEIAKQGAVPKLTYNISVVDLATLDKDYKVDIADTTYVEDIETFGINKKTGLPNRLKVIISGITYDLDAPTQNSIKIQNYTTQFEDLFQQVSASVQSLSFNENIYKRSSNFTSTQNISGESLQGGLSNNDLILLETNEKNIEIDKTGQSGSDINNHANKYKLSGEGLFFSNNGGQTWNVGVTPKGINADYIKVGSLDASKISIVDGDYLYFLWDKGGITAYRTPQATKENSDYFQDFARFNKYGLSLVENGKIKLRAGYEYRADSTENQGKINAEKEIDEDTNIGFYLYNSAGEKIFATENIKTEQENTAQETSKIQLQGELYVTNTSFSKVGTTTEYKYSHSYNIETIFYYNLILLDYSEMLKEKDLTVTTTGKNTIFSNVKKDIINSEYEFIQFVLYYCYTQKLSKLLTEDNTFIWIEENNTTEKFKVTLKSKQEIKKQNLLKTFSTDTYERIVEDLDKFLFSADTRIYNIYTYNNQAEIYYAAGQARYITVISEDPTNSLTQKERMSTSSLKILKNIKANQFKLITKTLYSTNNTTLYESEEVISNNNGDFLEGQTGLYINNKRAWEPIDNNEAAIEKERLFCVARTTKDDEDIFLSNIFTIFRNGNLYMGGKVNSNGESLKEAQNLPVEIDIDNYDIAIEDGIMKIDFTNIVNPDGQDLFDFVVETVNSKTLPSHKHRIEVPETLYKITEYEVRTAEGSVTTVQGQPDLPLADLLLFTLTGDSKYINGQKDSKNQSYTIKKSEKIEIEKSDKTIDWYTEKAGSGTAGTGGSGGFFSGYAWPDVIDQ